MADSTLRKKIVGMNRHSNRHTSANGSARCVQNFDDSLSSAIRMTYRISLRSSSLWEPRHPLLKVLVTLFLRIRISFHELSNQYFFFSFRKGIDIGLCFLTEARKNKTTVRGSQKELALNLFFVLRVW